MLQPGMGWAKAAREQHTASLLKVALGWNYNKLAAGETAVTDMQDLPARFFSAEVPLLQSVVAALSEASWRLSNTQARIGVNKPGLLVVC